MSDEPGAPRAPQASDPLEERLRSFEAFDRLIAENISRSGAMVREAIELRERAHREIAAERAALADLIAAERDKARAEGLARQADMQATITAALADLEVLRAEMDVVAARLRTITGSDAAPSAVAHVATDAPAPGAIESTATEPEVVAPEPPEAVADPESVADEALLVAGSDHALSAHIPLVAPLDTADDDDVFVEPDDVEETPPVEAEPAPAAEPTVPAGDLTLVVQGIRRAAVASALQRHLAAQPGVVAVEPSEFAGGIFRLHLVLADPFPLATLSAWPDAAAASIDHPAPGFLLVTLPA